jgi:hypothetical protein
MTRDDRDTLKELKAELNFIDKGGYGRSVRTPWHPTSIFRDSPICLNYADSERSHPCSECLLWDFVPLEDRAATDLPCHFIRVNSAGETIDGLERTQDGEVMEEEVKNWLRETIKRLEAEQKEFVPYGFRWVF